MDPYTNGTVAEIRFLGFWDRIVVDIDDLVQVSSDNLGNCFEFPKIILPV